MSSIDKPADRHTHIHIHKEKKHNQEVKKLVLFYIAAISAILVYNENYRRYRFIAIFQNLIF